jgi:hypothetical protein
MGTVFEKGLVFVYTPGSLRNAAYNESMDMTEGA